VSADERFSDGCKEYPDDGKYVGDSVQVTVDSIDDNSDEDVGGKK
jgi:hypothetical protein